MVLSKTLLSALAISAAVVDAAPTTGSGKITGLRHFTFEQVAAKKNRLRNPIADYARSLLKFNVDVPQNIRAAASNGSAVTNPAENDIQYITRVKVGDSELDLNIDTGSSDLWVYSQEMPASQSKGHDLYQPSENARKLEGHTWQIRYGDGSSARGDVWVDSVTIGGVTAEEQAVETAQQVSAQFTQDTDNDGLVGLAFSKINTVKPNQQKTFFDNVKDELDLPLFAVTLRSQAPGHYDFGYIDESRFKGEITYKPVDDSEGFWTFTADGYSVGDKGGTGAPITGIADTGTTLLLVDDSVLEDYYAEVPDAVNDNSIGGYVFPCNTKLPSFTVKINDYDAVIPGEYINYAPVDRTGTYCYGGIQSSQGLGFAIFGDVFLKSQYVVFDADGPKLGFAAQA